jgi:hypothetical protein
MVWPQGKRNPAGSAGSAATVAALVLVTEAAMVLATVAPVVAAQAVVAEDLEAPE